MNDVSPRFNWRRILRVLERFKTVKEFPENRLILASRNEGKLREIGALLAPWDLRIDSAAGLNLPEVAETGTTFEENARLKAASAVKAAGLAALADDSGLAVEALGGAPGVYSADWAGEGRDYTGAMDRIRRELEVAGGVKAAKFVCVLFLLWPDGRSITARGVCAGTLRFPPSGKGGFGYDPCFVPEGETRTFGDMPPADKARHSHRTRALQDLLMQLSR